MESELLSIFRVKLTAKNIFCNVMSLSEETNKFSEPNCFRVFLVKQYTSLIYVKEK